MQGFGKWEFLDHIYEGNFMDNVKTGRGTMKYFTGVVYTGSWENDLPREFYCFIFFIHFLFIFYSFFFIKRW